MCAAFARGVARKEKARAVVPAATRAKLSTTKAATVMRRGGFTYIRSSRLLLGLTGEFRPDSVPVIGTKVAPGDLARRRQLELSAKLRTKLLTNANGFPQVANGGTAPLSQFVLLVSRQLV